MEEREFVCKNSVLDPLWGILNNEKSWEEYDSAIVSLTFYSEFRDLRENIYKFLNTT